MFDVLHRLQQYYSLITTVADCCMRRDSVGVLSAANTVQQDTRTPHYPDTGPTGLGCILLMLSVYRGDTQCHIQRLWYGAAGAQIRALPSTRQTLLPLGHQAGCNEKECDEAITSIYNLNIESRHDYIFS